MANKPGFSQQLGQQQQLRQQMLAPHLQLTMQLLPLNTDQLNSYLHQQLEHNPLLSLRNHHSNTANSPLDIALATRQQQTGLADHLLWQLGLEQVNPRQHQYTEIIIDSLGPDGYLRTAFKELNEQLDDLPLDEPGWQQALTLVQSFEPTGVGARNLIECLSLQLEQNFPVDALQKLALQLVNNHLQALAKPDIVALAGQLNVTEPDINKAIGLVHSLNPRPGLIFDSRPTNYVQPDLRFVNNVNQSGFQAELTHSFSSLLQISGEGTANQQREAKALLSALTLREQSMLRVGELLALHQAAFLEHGVTAIRPLTRLQVAEQLGLHPSTITRTLQGKYAETPLGVIPLKDFFSVALQGKPSNPEQPGQTSDAPAAVAAIANLATLIRDEDHHHPLSDAELCQRLQQAGFPVARRTVVKYRQRLGIENSRKRREL